jgi:hypothetical protein
MGRRADRVERACWRSPYRRSGDRSHLAGLPYMLDRGRHCLFPFHDRRLWFRNRAQRGSSATNDDHGRNAGRPRRWPVPNTAGRHKVITECELGVWRTPTRRVAHSDPACGAPRPGMWRTPARRVARGMWRIPGIPSPATATAQREGSPVPATAFRSTPTLAPASQCRRIILRTTRFMEFRVASGTVIEVVEHFDRRSKRLLRRRASLCSRGPGLSVVLHMNPVR